MRHARFYELRENNKSQENFKAIWSRKQERGKPGFPTQEPHHRLTQVQLSLMACSPPLSFVITARGVRPVDLITKETFLLPGL